MSAPRVSVWPPLPPSVYAERPRRPLPWPLEEPGCQLFAWGRQALWHGVRALGLGPGDSVLVPAFHHGSEVEALRSAGLECRFYDGRDGIEPDEGELEALLAPSVRAMLLVHFLGFPQASPRWRAWCDAHGLLLLEDAAQSWLAQWEGRPVGSDADLAVFCLYKTFGVPEGAAAIARVPLPAPRANHALGLRDLVRRHGAWLAQRSAAVTLAADVVRGERAYRPERDVALGDPDSGPWSSVRYLLERVADPEAAEVRRAHYRMLLEHLGGTPPAFGGPLEGASPFVYPYMSGDKSALVGRLADAGVKALRFWSVPHPLLPGDRFPKAAALRAGVVGLPVHQELRPVDLDRVVGAVRRGAVGSGLRLEAVSRLEDVAADWRHIGGAGGNIFGTWEWASLWWRHFGAGRSPLVHACRRPDGSVAVILPLYLSSVRPLRVVRFLGHGVGDQLGPVCREGDEDLAGEALRRALERTSGWELFLGERLPGDGGWSGLLGATTLRRDASPVLRIDGRSWEELLASRSSNLRQQVRRRERNLARRHRLEYRLADDPARLDADLTTLFSLHEARWGRASGFTGAPRSFHRDFAKLALEQGWLRLWFLELDGVPAAAWYGFRLQRTESYYQAGRDPRWEREAVGFVLLAHTIREAAGDGMSTYRFLRGDEPYKARFTTDDPGLETVALAHGPRGHIGLAAAAGTRALPPEARRWAARVAG